MNKLMHGRRKKKNIKYFETSAKNGLNIKEAFDTLFKDIYYTQKNKNNSGEEGGFSIEQKNAKSKGKKC